MGRILIGALALVLAMPPASAQAAENTTQWVTTPASFGKIYDPSPAAGRPTYINDHAFVRDPKTGTWHMYGITHAEPADPDNEIEFAHATAPGINGPWTTQRPALTVDRAYGETHLWAPHVILVGDTYYMFYNGGGPSNAHQINLATSKDLFTWTRLPSGPLFRDGIDARDPMVTRIGDRWVMYYTATLSSSGHSNHVVAYRTSTDLINWSARGIAYTDPLSGTFGGPTESPFVVEKDGWYYLFVCCRIDYVSTAVYRSRDPFHFDVSEQVGHVPAHAAEVVRDGDTAWISAAGWGQGGVWLAPLSWAAQPFGEFLYAQPPGGGSVDRWDGRAWTKVGGPAGRVYGGGAGVLATNPSTGDVYKYGGAPDRWTRIGGPGRTFAVNSAGIYGLAPDGSAVLQWVSGDSWVRIGGPAGTLYAGGNTLLATNPATGDVYRYMGSPDHWMKVGGPGRMFAVSSVGVFGLAPDGSAVMQWTGNGERWAKVGGPAGAIYAAGNTLLATNPSTGDVYRYRNAPGAWELFGGPGRSFAISSAGVFGLSPDGSGVFHRGSAGWVKIGGAARVIVGG